MRSTVLCLSLLLSFEWMILSLALIEGDDDEVCGLYMAKAVDDPLTLTLYMGIDKKKNSVIDNIEELVISMIDPNKNEYSPWHDYVWGEEIFFNYKDTSTSMLQPAKYIQDFLLGGLGSMITCNPTANVQFHNKAYLASKQHGLEYYADHDAISDYHHFYFQTTTNIDAGEMLLIQCDGGGEDNKHHEKLIMNITTLQKRGICVDTIHVDDSTIKGAGRGAFAKHYFEKGEVIIASPVIQLDRSQINIVYQQESNNTERFIPIATEDDNYNDIEYNNTNILGQQLLINYVYGHPDSNVLLFPYGPGVNFINHNNKKPNVGIRWSNKFGNTIHYREDVPVMEFLEMPGGRLVIEYIALQTILPHDELFINYGDLYEKAYKQHLDGGGSSTTSTKSKKPKNNNNKEDYKPFRHEIIVPDGFYPDNWMRTDPYPDGDFIPSKLPLPGLMAPIRWKETADVVTPWAFRIGLNTTVRSVLLDYCNKMGITDIFKYVTIEGNGLQPGTELYMDIDGYSWYLQRPEAKWRSNLQWFSPGDSAAHEHYLQALSVAGFDEILEGIGDYLGLDGLVAFHVTFIAVSFSTKGYLHHDVINTGNKVFNVIIPLLLANETGPELDLQSWLNYEEDEGGPPIGRYRYEYDVASMMGDGAMHATSSCDYRYNNEMRMAATVYVADVNEENAEEVMNHYTQAYPPPDLDLLKSWEARHWKRDDPSRKLPKPAKDHLLVTGETAGKPQKSKIKPRSKVSRSYGEVLDGGSTKEVNDDVKRTYTKISMQGLFGEKANTSPRRNEEETDDGAAVGDDEVGDDGVNDEESDWWYSDEEEEL